MTKSLNTLLALSVMMMGCQPTDLEEALHFSQDNTRGWGMIHYAKTPSRDRIIKEIIPNSLGNRIVGWDSIYVTQSPSVPEELNTEYTVTSETFIIFLFFCANKKQTYAKGFVFDPEGKERLKYLCSTDSTIYNIWKKHQAFALTTVKASAASK